MNAGQEGSSNALVARNSAAHRRLIRLDSHRSWPGIRSCGMISPPTMNTGYINRAAHAAAYLVTRKRHDSNIPSAVLDTMTTDRPASIQPGCRTRIGTPSTSTAVTVLTAMTAVLRAVAPRHLPRNTSVGERTPVTVAANAPLPRSAVRIPPADQIVDPHNAVSPTPMTTWVLARAERCCPAFSATTRKTTG